jgi:hypothetical protein
LNTKQIHLQRDENQFQEGENDFLGIKNEFHEGEVQFQRDENDFQRGENDYSG